MLQGNDDDDDKHSNDNVLAITADIIGKIPASELELDANTKLYNGEPLIGRFERLIHKNRGTKTFIFFKHIRKAGGTSMREFIADAICYHNDTCLRLADNVRTPRILRGNNVTYYEQEFRAFHWQCPEVDAHRWNRTLSVVVLRYPISRHISEFFYSGKPSRELVRIDRYKNTAKYLALLEIEMIDWMLIGNEILNSKVDKYLGRYFVNEYQVRALAGETDHDPNAVRKPQENSPHCTNGCHEAPCFYGGGFNGGANHTIVISERALERAKRSLQLFDIVLVTETINSDIAFLSDVFGLPYNYTSIGTYNKNRKGYGDTPNMQVMEIHAPRLHTLLQNRTRYEMILYNHAVMVHQNLLQQWEKEKGKNKMSS